MHTMRSADAYPPHVVCSSPQRATYDAPRLSLAFWRSFATEEKNEKLQLNEASISRAPLY